MIMKNKKYSIGSWLLVFSYGLLVNYFPFSISFLPITTAATESNKNFKSKFLEMTLNIPEEEKDKKAKNELRRIIEQIRSINLELQKEVFEPVIVPDKASKVEPNEVVLEDKDVKEQQKKEIEPSPPNGIIARQTIQIIRKFSQNPNNLKNPFELAETLFLSGYLKEAAIFYKEALKHKSPDDVDSARDRAWILFQIGNCLRIEDRPAAIKFYGQLITEYPDSPWTDLAKTREKLIDWYLKDKPETLIRDAIPQ